jgi:hypothetical protein
MNAQLIDNLIMVAIGAGFTFARGRFVALISDPQKKQKANLIFKFGGPIILGCGILLTIGNLITTKDDKNDLNNVARAINATAPKMVDEATRLDGASAGPDRRLTYNLTLVSQKAQDIDRAAWKQNVAPKIRANMIQTQGMHTLLAAGVTVVGRYSSSDGVLIDEIVYKARGFIHELITSFK